MPIAAERDIIQRGIHLKQDSVRRSRPWRAHLLARFQPPSRVPTNTMGLCAGVGIFNALVNTASRAPEPRRRPAFPKAVCIATSSHGTPRSLPGVAVLGNEGGRSWLIRLVVATLLVFGLKRGVGAETVSELAAVCAWRGMWGAHPAPCEPSCTRWSASSWKPPQPWRRRRGL